MNLKTSTGVGVFDVYPLYWTNTSKGGFKMRYSYEFKLKCVEAYRKGQWIDTPKGVKTSTFRCKIRYWTRIANEHGPEALRHNSQNRKWTADERYNLVAKVLAGYSCTSVAVSAGINHTQLFDWVRKYKELGYNGLVNMRQGRPRKEPEMKKKVSPTELNESEREELIRLRAELE